MVSFGNHPPCWISSIVKLPMLYEPGQILYGSMYAETSEVYEPLTLIVHQGRDIQIPKGFTKYKFELRCNDSIADVIAIADADFDPSNIMSSEFDNVGLWPIYIHYGRDCFMFIEAINDLFCKSGMVVSNTGSNFVRSPMGIIKSIDDIMYPGALPDNNFDLRFSRVQRPDGVLEIVMMELNSDSQHFQEMNQLETTYGIPHGVLPLEVEFLANVRNVSQVRRFLNPYGQVPSDVASHWMSFVQNGDETIKQLRAELMSNNALPDRVSDIYMTEAEDRSYTGAWLSGIYSNHFSDFTFPLRFDERNVSDLYAKRCHIYDGFRHSFERLVNWKSLTDYLILSFNIVKSSIEKDIEFQVQRSWAEDLVIRDPSGHIVTYVDMVLWMLCCCDGLINDSILHPLQGPTFS